MNQDILETVNPPRKNGELIFDAPWEGRSFGLALALQQQGILDWGEFRARLVASIAADQTGDYYEQWLDALESILVDKEIFTPQEIKGRINEFARGTREISY